METALHGWREPQIGARVDWKEDPTRFWAPAVWAGTFYVIFVVKGVAPLSWRAFAILLITYCFIWLWTWLWSFVPRTIVLLPKKIKIIQSRFPRRIPLAEVVIAEVAKTPEGSAVRLVRQTGRPLWLFLGAGMEVGEIEAYFRRHAIQWKDANQSLQPTRAFGPRG
ncbi:MAG TPA: hypothetical protein VHD61_07185 [Lacunisphaera sp.]|nr:hypothetical protein [Lacunisphaera sp.]